MQDCIVGRFWSREISHCQSVTLSLIVRFVDEGYNDKYQATIGACYYEKEVLIGPKLIKMALWDTAGQERFSSLASFYYRGAKAAIVVFDLTQDASFERAKLWMRELHDALPYQIIIILVGNKVDLDSRVVPYQVFECSLY